MLARFFLEIFTMNVLLGFRICRIIGALLENEPTKKAKKKTFCFANMKEGKQRNLETEKENF